MVITLSRQLGSYGDAIAAHTVAALGLLLVDRKYISEAALAAGVPATLLQKLMYEGPRNLAADLLESLGSVPREITGTTTPPANPLGGIFAPMLLHASVNLEEAVQNLGQVIRGVAGRGKVLLLGQGSQVWLRDHPDALHVQVIAPLDLRIARVARRGKLTQADASRLVRANDNARADYMARYHNVTWLNPELYHLVINTGFTSVESAASLIVHAARLAEGQTLSVAQAADVNRY